MKIITTAILLGITLLFIPLFSYFFGTALGAVEREALVTVIVIATIAAAYSFIVGELTCNNSQVDKLWSILPVVYAWVVAGVWLPAGADPAFHTSNHRRPAKQPPSPGTS